MPTEIDLLTVIATPEMTELMEESQRLTKLASEMLGPLLDLAEGFANLADRIQETQPQLTIGNDTWGPDHYVDLPALSHAVWTKAVLYRPAVEAWGGLIGTVLDKAGMESWNTEPALAAADMLQHLTDPELLDRARTLINRELPLR